MKECDPELYHTLNYLKNNNDANLKEEIDTNFTVIGNFTSNIILLYIANPKMIPINSYFIFGSNV